MASIKPIITRFSLKNSTTKATMVVSLFSARNAFFISLCLFAALYRPVLSKPAKFADDFRITWSDTHITQIDGGRAIQLKLDPSSGSYMHHNQFYINLINIYLQIHFKNILVNIGLGCGFASKKQYLFGRVSMKIKLIPGDSAGTVAAFYVIYIQIF